MKKFLAIALAVLSVVCLATLNREPDITYEIELEEFGHVMNDINTCIAKVISNPGILEVDLEFRKDFRESLMFARSIIKEWKGDRIVEAAKGQYRAYFDEILASLDFWSPEVASRLQIMSRDAYVTLRTCIARLT